MQKIFARFSASIVMVIASVLALTMPQVISTTPAAAAPHFQATSNNASGPIGQRLVVDAYKNVADMQRLTVKGQGYDLKVGIYVTFCVIPAKGRRPELCGPFDITGQNNQAVWVSSNPPLYAVTLVTPFDKVASTAKGKKVETGSFTVQVPATRMIGKYDCKVVRCAILTRADHTRSDYRKADVIIPITFK